MKRSDFYKVIMEECHGNVKKFEMTYKKKDGSIRKASCQMYDPNAEVKGVGESRDQKVKNHNVFQYFDLNSNAYRSAKIENIIDVTIDGKLEKVED